MAEKRRTQEGTSAAAQMLRQETPQETGIVTRDKTEVDQKNGEETAVADGNDGGGGEKEPMSFSVSIDLTLLNTDLAAVFERRKITDDVKRTAILVLPTDEPKGGMTLQELVNEVNALIKSFTGQQAEVSTDDMQEGLKNFNLMDLNAISVELRQVFLYYCKLDGGETPGTELEYAVNFVIRNKVDPDTDLKMFKFKSLSASIWNTTRPKILDRMTLGSIEELLK